MAFVDELTIYAKSGDGGDGVVRWRQEKFVPKGGPSGGDGGAGGDVYLESVKDISLLAHYSHNPKFIAQNGQPGSIKSMQGESGDDLVIAVPVGSIVTDKDRGLVYDFTSAGQKIKILSGGKGGYGNEHFKASTNTTPYEWTPGKTGEDANLHIELRLFADIGLVGFPNAGKSTLIQSLTKSKSKIGAYSFTTLDPHLGAFHDYIIADIPGIIEGASEGKGLGYKFLKHISRTKTIAHLVSFENELEKEGGMIDAYVTIRKELGTYDSKLLEKKECVILTKTDLVSLEIVEKVETDFKNKNIEVLSVSMFDDVDVKKVSQTILDIVKEL
jgi:GTP-binding protein